jgi:hypothetical protein
VDASYSGGNNDGSQDRPWTALVDAVTAAQSGAVIAIAAGSYQGDLWVQSKSVRLWGRCPELVEIVGTPNSMGTVVFTTGADGSQVQQLALTGFTGISMSGATDVLVRRTWIHDTSARGMEVEDPVGPTGAAVEDSLIESTGNAGVFYGGSQGAVTRSAVRYTAATNAGFGNAGIAVSYNPVSMRAGTLVVRSCVIEQNGLNGLHVAGAIADVQDTIIRDSFPNTANEEGRGITVGSVGAVAGDLQLRQSVIERNYEGGVAALAAHVTLENVTIRDTFARAIDGHDGRCLQIQDSPEVRPTVSVRTSLLERCVGGGVMAVSSDVLIESSVIRNITPRPADNGFGDGVAVAAEPAAASLQLIGSLIQDTSRAGAAVFGGQMTVSATRLRCNGIPLVSQDYLDNPGVFVDGGDNSCGCDDEPDICKAESAELAPPTAL